MKTKKKIHKNSRVIYLQFNDYASWRNCVARYTPNAVMDGDVIHSVARDKKTHMLLGAFAQLNGWLMYAAIPRQIVVATMAAGPKKRLEVETFVFEDEGCVPSSEFVVRRSGKIRYRGQNLRIAESLFYK